jgi:hypothetical protein
MAHSLNLAVKSELKLAAVKAIVGKAKKIAPSFVVHPRLPIFFPITKQGLGSRW